MPQVIERSKRYKKAAENAITTPHIGYVTRGIYETFYGHTVENILAWLEGQPIRVME